MPRKIFFGESPQSLRQKYARAYKAADRLLAEEDGLIQELVAIDAGRLYVRFGYKSLRTFCTEALRLSKTQSQRIVTQVRRKRWSAEDNNAIKSKSALT